MPEWAGGVVEVAVAGGDEVRELCMHMLHQLLTDSRLLQKVVESSTNPSTTQGRLLAVAEETFELVTTVT